MRLIPILALLLALSGFSSGQLTGSYSIIADENGTALVTLVASGQGTVNVPLPLDVKSPAVRDALYVKAQNGVEVSVDAAGQSTILYKTILLASRDGDAVKFRLDLPRFDSATVILYVPEDAEVSETEPTAAITHVGLSKSIVWSVRPSETKYVQAQYSMPKPQAEGGDRRSLLTAGLVLVLVLLATAVSVYLILKRKATGEM